MTQKKKYIFLRGEKDMISNGFTYIAFLMCLAGVLLFAEKYTKSKALQKVFNYVPPLVWIYVLNMIFCTAGLFNFNVLKYNLSIFLCIRRECVNA